MKKIFFSCSVCGRKVEADPSAPAPECCGERMIPEPLPLCSIPVSAESSRTAGEDGPCADGSTPRKG